MADMGRVVIGARRVPAEALAARNEAHAVREDARREAERIRDEARVRARLELEEARRLGRAEGLAQAAATLAEAQAARARAATLREREIAELALAVARRVVRDCRALDAKLVARRVADVIRERFLGTVVVRVPPAEVERVRAALAATAPERDVTVREDPELHEGICVLEGDGGLVRLDDEQIVDRIGRALAADAKEGAE
jgi:type III secretion protein L